MLQNRDDIKSSFMIDSFILRMIDTKSFLYKGVIIVSFQSCGSFRYLYDSVYKIDKGTEKLTESSFNILRCKLSTPVDL